MGGGISLNNEQLFQVFKNIMVDEITKSNQNKDYKPCFNKRECLDFLEFLCDHEQKKPLNDNTYLLYRNQLIQDQYYRLYQKLYNVHERDCDFDHK